MDLDKANMSEITNAQMGKEFVSKSDDRHTSHNRERFVILLLLFVIVPFALRCFCIDSLGFILFFFFTIYAWHGWLAAFFSLYFLVYPFFRPLFLNSTLARPVYQYHIFMIPAMWLLFIHNFVCMFFSSLSLVRFPSIARCIVYPIGVLTIITNFVDGVHNR